MRLLYTGPSDDQAQVRRFDDDQIPQALLNGWRLTRRNDAPVEPEEPGSDQNVAPADEQAAQQALADADAQSHTADDDAPQTDDSDDTDDPPAEQRPEDSEPPSNARRGKHRRR